MSKRLIDTKISPGDKVLLSNLNRWVVVNRVEAYGGFSIGIDDPEECELDTLDIVYEYIHDNKPRRFRINSVKKVEKKQEQTSND